MIRKLIPFFLILISFSCTKQKEEVTPAPISEPVPLFLQPDQYVMTYMLYPANSFPGYDKPVVKLEYNVLGNVIKRTGGLLHINPNSGFGEFFNPGIYEDISYNGNKITITQADTFKTLNVWPNPKPIFLDAQSRIQKTIKETTIYNTTYDTVLYYYSAGKLAYTVLDNYPNRLTRNFFFDAAENLTKTEAISINRFYNDTLFLETEIFTDYDNAPNPLKRLGIFDELFYRSLSQNNFRKYTFQRTDKAGYVTATNNRTWQFRYDINGNVIFNE